MSGPPVARPWERGVAVEWQVAEALQAIARELQAARGLVGRRVRLAVDARGGEPEQTYIGEVLFAALESGGEEAPSYLVISLVLEGTGLVVTRWIVPGDDELMVLS